MVVTVAASHIYKYPVEIVYQTHLTKYPNKKERHVIRVDTLHRTYDVQTGIEYRRRLATCKNILPKFLRKLKVLDVDSIYLEEECTHDTRGRVMHILSRSLTWTEYACATEESTFRPHRDNNKWTSFEQTGSIDIRGFGSFGRVLEMFARGFLIQGVNRSLTIMEDILRERTSEVTPVNTPSVN